MNRRGFLKLLGSAGLVTAVAPDLLLAEPEPVRRFWQVSRKAPVREPAIFGVEEATYPLWRRWPEDFSPAAYVGWDPGSAERSRLVVASVDRDRRVVTVTRAPEPMGYADAWDIGPIQDQIDAIAREHIVVRLVSLKPTEQRIADQLQRVMAEKLANHRALFERRAIQEPARENGTEYQGHVNRVFYPG